MMTLNMNPNLNNRTHFFKIGTISKILVILIAASVFYGTGCDSDKTISTKEDDIIILENNFDSLFVKTVEINLDSDSFLFSGSGSINFMNSETLLVADTQLNIATAINLKGEKLREYGKIGKGPFEFSYITSAFLVGQNIALYDRTIEKLVLYTFNGDPIKELGGFPYQSFVHWYKEKPDELFFYSTYLSAQTKSDEPNIFRYDLNGKKIIGFGRNPEYRTKLSVPLVGGGNFKYYNDKIYQANAFEYKVNVFNANDGSFQFSFGNPTSDFIGFDEVIKNKKDGQNFDLYSKLTKIDKIEILQTQKGPILMLGYLIIPNPKDKSSLVDVLDLYKLDGSPVVLGIKMKSKKFITTYDQKNILVVNLETFPYKYEIYQFTK